MPGLLIWSISTVWSALSALMRAAVAAGIVRPRRLAAGRVVSVGNIQVGGSGKTPLVAQIAREAAERGLSVCILCRGYGAEWETRGGVISPESLRVDAHECGDEAALLHDLAPRAYIGVGADRVRQYEQARSRFGRDFDLVVLDDGFQHWKISKELEIVAVTSARRTRTIFRDFTSALRSAQLVVATKGDVPPIGGRCPEVRVRFELAAPASRAPLWLVTGVADGGQAAQFIRDAGYPVARHISFPDHARYSEDMVRGILEGARKAGCAVVVTGKDWVKWRSFGIADGQVQVLEPAVVFEEGRELWSRTLWGS
jgi:tetraacyldisaccharide 4'-kinase